MAPISEKIRICCPHCQRKLKIKPRAAGTDQPCPGCGGVIHVQEATQQQSTPPPIPDIGVQQTAAAERLRQGRRWPGGASLKHPIGFVATATVVIVAAVIFANLSNRLSDATIERGRRADEANRQLPTSREGAWRAPNEQEQAKTDALQLEMQESVRRSQNAQRDLDAAKERYTAALRNYDNTPDLDIDANAVAYQACLDAMREWEEAQRKWEEAEAEALLLRLDYERAAENRARIEKDNLKRFPQPREAESKPDSVAALRKMLKAQRKLDDALTLGDDQAWNAAFYESMEAQIEGLEAVDRELEEAIRGFDP